MSWLFARQQVERIAQEERADQVLSIHLAIGPLSGVESRLLEQAFSVARAGSVAASAELVILSGVESRLLEQAFSVARAGSIAASAELVIESMPVQVNCKQCGQLTEALPGRLVCGSCGDWRTSLISGDELELRHVELIRQTAEDSFAPARRSYNS